MKHIRAIETRYAGYLFRSRLEARWAVFFDAMKIPWQYEREGFQITDHLRYLPDFYLPDWDQYVEVKPNLPQDFAEDGMVVMVYTEEGTTETGKFMLAWDHLTKRQDGEPTLPGIFMLCGVPGVPNLKCINGMWKLHDGAVALGMMKMPGGPVFHIQAFSTDLKGGGLDVWPLYIEGNAVSDGRAYTSPMYPSGLIGRHYIGSGRSFDSPALRQAYTAARSARFEHGAEPVRHQ